MQEAGVAPFDFEELQAWSLDIVMSTGEGKPKQSEFRSTVFKRNGEKYNLKQASSRELMTYVKQNSETLAWSTRSIKEKMGAKAMLGLKEMNTHELLMEYPVMAERAKDLVAQFKYTVLILPSKTEKLNSAPLPYVSSDKKVVNKEVAAILETSLTKSKKKKGKKKGKAGEDAPPLVSE